MSTSKNDVPETEIAGPMMTGAYRVSGLLIVALALFLGWHATRMQFYTAVGPGAGFFPVILSIALGGLGAVMIFQTFVGPQEQAASAEVVPDRKGLLRVCAVLAGIVFFVLALSTFGFRLTTFMLSIFLIHTFGRVNVIASLLVSAGLGLGIHYVFSDLLRIALPSGIFGF